MLRLPVSLIVFLVTVGSVALHARPTARDTADPSTVMLAAATSFMASLSPKQLEKAVVAFTDDERKNWHYVPRGRQGLPLKEMNADQRAAAFELLRSGLSSQGYLKATSVFSLETVLREMAEARGRSAPHRDPELYYFTVFVPGDGKKPQPWGWRVEGHHLSLNYCSVRGEIVTIAPAFWGANPARVTTGPSAGLQVLGEEQAGGFRLLNALTPDQQKKAVISGRAPRDIILSPGKGSRLEKQEGLPASEMTSEQRRLLLAIVEELAHNLKPAVAEAELRRIREASVERLHFAWAGSREPGQRHYYRIHGPTVIIEYDCTEGGPGHIHTVWHDPTRHFGGDLLKKHHEQFIHR